jgi:Beta-propeller repeat
MSKIIPATLIALAVSSLCHAEVGAPYGRLPMAFELNQGQTDPAVHFLARGQGYGLYLTSKEAVLSLRAPSSQSDTVVRMQIAGVSSHARVSGADELPGVSNYFVGNDPGHWHTNIPNYAKVKYSGVYPGVDLVYYGNQQSLEYDFVVAPGANADVIALDFKGVRGLRVSEAGDLVLVTGNGDLLQHKPLIYQYVRGQRRVIQGRYVVQGMRARFQVSRYDHTQPLVIDPTLAYSTYFGGKDFDDGYGIAVDASGAAYVTGFIYSSDFPGAWGRERPTRGNGDAFVAKLSRDGSQLVYSTILGGTGQDLGHGIAVDSKGGAYVTGYTHSQDFPTTRWAVQDKFLSTAGQNAFVAHLDAYGALSYSTYLGGAGRDVGQAIAVDSSDNAYVTGYTSSGNFPTTARAFQRGLSGLQNAFITKLNPTGTAIEYSTLLGGNDYDFGFGIAVNNDGNAYVTGTTYGIFSSTFPTTSNAYQTASSGSGDAFVSKLSADGSALVYSTFLGGTGYDGGRGIALDTSGNAYVAGYTQSNAFPTTAGAAQTALNGTEDAFVTKLNSDGSALVYSTYLGGSGNDAGFGIAVGTNGYAYVTGFTQSADFPTTAAAIQNANGTGKEPFVAALNASGAQLAYSTYLGGSNGDGGYAIAVDSSNNAYVTGYTNSVDFPVTQGAYRNELTTGASQDAFIAKLSFASSPAP